jgi:hypothetical protein
MGVRGSRPPQAATHAQDRSTITVGRADRCAPSTDLFQPLGSTTPLASDSNVAISGAMLSQPPLLQKVEQGRDQHPGLQGPSLWDQSKSWASPTLLREGVDSTKVSPFAFTFGGLHNLIHSPRSCPFVGSHVFSQRAMRGHLT